MVLLLKVSMLHFLHWFSLLVALLILLHCFCEVAVLMCACEQEQRRCKEIKPEVMHAANLSRLLSLELLSIFLGLLTLQPCTFFHGVNLHSLSLSVGAQEVLIDPGMVRLTSIALVVASVPVCFHWHLPCVWCGFDFLVNFDNLRSDWSCFFIFFRGR